MYEYMYPCLNTTSVGSICKAEKHPDMSARAGAGVTREQANIFDLTHRRAAPEKVAGSPEMA